MTSSFSSFPSSHEGPSVEGSLPVVSLYAASPAEGNPDMVGHGSSVSSGTPCIVPAAGGDGQEQADVAEVPRECRPVVVAGTGKSTEVVGLTDNSGGGDYGAVRARGTAGSRDRDRCLTAEIGFRMSRFNGSAWVSFSSQHCRPTEPKSDFPSDPNTQLGHDEQDVRSGSEEEVVHTTEIMKAVGVFRW